MPHADAAEHNSAPAGAPITHAQSPERAELKPMPNPNPAQPGIASNYRYWQENGSHWADEYDDRKTVQPLYHIQELMLTDYVSRFAPAKVLEFGCGVGRHLANLSRLPGIDVHGYDQSPTMVGECLRWTGRDWLDSHVTVGPPTGRLPYTDKSFDLVYSAEVLVHVRPEHLEGVLSEMIRVARGHVFHLETSPHHNVVSSCHDGCWKHDLVAAYSRLGHSCEVLPAGYSAHTPYRVILDQKTPRYVWSPVLLGLARRAEEDLSRGFRAAKGECEGLRTMVANVRSEEARRREAMQAHECKTQAAGEEAMRANAALKEHAAALERALSDARAAAAALRQRIDIAEAEKEELRRQGFAVHQLRTQAEVLQREADRARSLERDAAHLRSSLARQMDSCAALSAELERRLADERDRVARLLSEKDRFVTAVRRFVRR